ncbi:MAG: pilin [Magnetococcales bacterium]|nr:pilin [Magnetococcales bacterium]
MSSAPLPLPGEAPPVYHRERPLFVLSLVISLILWILMVVGTMGGVLIYVVMAFLIYLFAQSAFIVYLKGSAVRITARQFPDLHQRLLDSSRRIGMAKVPEAYLLHANGVFNALATRFLGRDFLVLFADVVDALEESPESLNFYLGHELGHLHRKHLLWGPVLWPASVLPLLGSAYHRAREYTCDRYGLACAPNPEVALRGLAALATGGKRWKSLDLGEYVDQIALLKGFWGSLHELLGDYPPLVKRVNQLLPAERRAALPGRNPFAWILCLFVPRLGPGTGASAGILVVVAVFGIMAAVAFPAYQDYVARAKVAAAIGLVADLRTQVDDYYLREGKMPESLEEAGIASPITGSDLQEVMLLVDGSIQVTFGGGAPLGGGSLVFTPELDSASAPGGITWSCGSPNIADRYLPIHCHSEPRFGD